MTRWYVVDNNELLGRVRFEPGHPDEASALIELVDRYADLPHVDSPDRFQVEQQDVTALACAVAVQTTHH